MAGSSDRYSRESFASANPGGILGFSPPSKATDWRHGPETTLAVFVAIQCALSAWLLANNMLDLTAAACLSTGLIAVAAMFAQQRTEGALPAATPCAPAELASSVSEILVSRFEPAFLTTIDEQSQTWADLTARISHELRTPLNAVIGFSDLMERELFGPLGNARYRDYAAHIKDSGEALLKSAEDTLALSALLVASNSDQRSQASSLSALALEAWHGVAPQAHRRGVSLELMISDTLEVAGDRRALRQALMNLLIEALSRADAGAPISVSAQADGDTVTIKFAVTGSKPLLVPRDPSLAICVARALLELQGTSLVTSTLPGRCGWQASTVLDLAVQSDFFAGPRRPAAAECRA